MKLLFKSFLFNVFALWVTAQVFPGFVIVGNVWAVAGAGFALTFLLFLVKPFLKILFIPINFITFGLLSWLVNVVILYLLTLFVPETRVIAWTFPGATWAGFVVPPIRFSYQLSLVVASFILTFFTDLLHNISETA